MCMSFVIGVKVLMSTNNNEKKINNNHSFVRQTKIGDRSRGKQNAKMRGEMRKKG